MSLRIITGEAVERAGVILMARVLGSGGIPFTQASVNSLTFEVGYIDTPPELRPPTEGITQATPVRTSSASETLTKTDVVFDTLQTGPTWLVVAAAPAANGATVLYVDPLRGALPAGKVLDFQGATARLLAPAKRGARQLSAVITGTIGVGEKAVAGTPQSPPSSPWKVDELGYNFRMDLPAAKLPAIPIGQFPKPRFYVVSVECTPTVGEVFGWEYRLETHHRLHGKWVAA